MTKMTDTVSQTPAVSVSRLAARLSAGNRSALGMLSRGDHTAVVRAVAEAEALGAHKVAEAIRQDASYIAATTWTFGTLVRVSSHVSRWVPGSRYGVVQRVNANGTITVLVSEGATVHLSAALLTRVDPMAAAIGGGA